MTHPHVVFSPLQAELWVVKGFCASSPQGFGVGLIVEQRSGAGGGRSAVSCQSAADDP